ncbi:MAG: hypothetical protein ACI8S6_003151 [Myxococcota bacterium]|jgi:hypothetical protein
MLALMKMIWRSWKRLVHGLNGAISWTLMSIAYIIAIGPVATYFIVTRTDLTDRGLGDTEAESYWISLPPDEDDIRRAQRPW